MTGSTDKRVARSRQRVLDAARQILSSKGIQGLTHQAVAEAASIGRATVYRHWPDHTSLVADTVGSIIAADPLIEGGDPHHRVVLRLRQLRDRLEGDLGGVFVGLLARADYEAALVELREQLMQPRITALVDDLRALGHPHPTYRAQLLVGALFLRRFQLGLATSDHVIDELMAS